MGGEGRRKKGMSRRRRRSSLNANFTAAVHFSWHKVRQEKSL